MIISIVGAGASSICCLDQLIEQSFAHKDQRHLTKILIFEKGRGFGRGLAYSTENILNMHNGTMLLRPDEPHDNNTFIAKTGVCDGGYSPRLQFGEYLEQYFHMLLLKAKACGILVELHNNSEVTDIIKHKSGFILEVAKKFYCV